MTNGTQSLWSGEMSPISPDQIALTDAHRQELDRLTRAGRTEQRLVVRAGIVLLAADGYPNSEIAARLGVCEDTARKWRRRWCTAPGVPSLGDAHRSGRRPVFTAVQVARVKAVACRPPKDCGLPLSRWSGPAGHDRGDLWIDLVIGGPPVVVRGRPQAVAVRSG